MKNSDVGYRGNSKWEKKTEMEWIQTYFRWGGRLKGVILGIVDRQSRLVTDFTELALRDQYFIKSYDVESPLESVAMKQGYGEVMEDGYTYDFVSRNIDSPLVCKKLEQFLQSVGKEESALIGQVSNEVQIEVIRRYGGIVIDISSPVNRPLISSVEVEGHVLEFPLVHPSLLKVDAVIPCATVDQVLTKIYELQKK